MLAMTGTVRSSPRITHRSCWYEAEAGLLSAHSPAVKPQIFVANDLVSVTLLLPPIVRRHLCAAGDRFRLGPEREQVAKMRVLGGPQMAEELTDATDSQHRSPQPDPAYSHLDVSDPLGSCAPSFSVRQDGPAC
jgi:hypothetical protein